MNEEKKEIVEKALDINDQPTANEFIAYHEGLVQVKDQNTINSYLKNSVQLANDQQNNAIALIGGMKGIKDYLGEVKEAAYKNVIMDIAGRALNFAEASVEFSFTSQDGSNEGTTKSIEAKAFNFTNEMLTPNLISRLNSIGIYNFVYNNVLPYTARQEYPSLGDLNSKVNGLLDANGEDVIDFNNGVFKVVDGKITIDAEKISTEFKTGEELGSVGLVTNGELSDDPENPRDLNLVSEESIEILNDNQDQRVDKIVNYLQAQ
ncbi:MAG: hypothetical protein GY830_03995 [Bacteroidetes bacterium]|nr:hypothetical protein [Bacteroidota bacterium]